MDKFEDAIFEHNPLYKEGLQDKYYQGAKWAWQSRQSEFDAMTEALLKQTQLLAKKKAEINQLQSQINEMAEVGLSQESELNKKDEHAHNLFYENANLQALVEEKDKRIEELENLMKMQECGANKIYEIALKGVRKTGGDYYLEKIIDLLRGEHANS